jgi:hypothetical protein
MREIRLQCSDVLSSLSYMTCIHAHTLWGNNSFNKGDITSQSDNIHVFNLCLCDKCVHNVAARLFACRAMRTCAYKHTHAASRKVHAAKYATHVQPTTTMLVLTHSTVNELKCIIIIVLLSF